MRLNDLIKAVHKPHWASQYQHLPVIYIVPETLTKQYATIFIPEKSYPNKFTMDHMIVDGLTINFLFEFPKTDLEEQFNEET